MRGLTCAYFSGITLNGAPDVPVPLTCSVPFRLSAVQVYSFIKIDFKSDFRQRGIKGLVR